MIIGPDGAPWITDSGLNAIVRVDPATRAVKRFPLPIAKNANLNTATFDKAGRLWFTGQAGYHGRVDPRSGKVEVWESPRGRGPYGITTTPAGEVYYASLAGNHIARIDRATGKATPIEPPTPGQGARRVWSDSDGTDLGQRMVVGAGQRLRPEAAASGKAWRAWKLPGAKPQAYSVWVDENDKVWLTDFSANAIVRFDPETRELRELPQHGPQRRRAADAGPQGRSLGRRVGRGSAGGGEALSGAGACLLHADSLTQPVDLRVLHHGRRIHVACQLQHRAADAFGRGQQLRRESHAQAHQRPGDAIQRGERGMRRMFVADRLDAAGTQHHGADRQRGQGAFGLAFDPQHHHVAVGIGIGAGDVDEGEARVEPCQGLRRRAWSGRG